MTSRDKDVAMNNERNGWVGNRTIRRSLVWVAFVGACLNSGVASAYTGAMHHRIGDQAFEAMNLVRRGQFVSDVLARQFGQSFIQLTTFPAATLPASAQPSWNRFIADVAAAPDKLEKLLSDLPDPPNPSAACANAFPAAAPLRLCRAADLPFVPDRNYGDTGSTVCNFVSQYYFGGNNGSEFYQGVQNSLTGGLLGYYAMKPDDFVQDTDLFILPTNVLDLGALNQAAVDTTDVSLAIFLAPALILIDLFEGGDPLTDALRDAHDLDPIPYLDTLVPGFGDFTGNMFGVALAGMWHFFNVQTSGQFNSTPGLRFDSGGYLGVTDALDLLLIGAADLTGITVNPDKSQGTKNYVPFEDGPERRRKGDWLYGVAHTEFEPVDNLGQWALNVSANTNDAGASGIGWALHAIGDAACPQHTISSPGWGHAVYEGYAADFFESVHGASYGDQGTDAQLARYNDFLDIIQTAFRYWSFMDSIQQARNSTAVPIRDLLVQEANDTYNLSSSTGVFIPIISAGYAALAALNATSAQISTEFGNYGGSVTNAATKSLVIEGTAVAVAFLAKAADVVHISTMPDPCFPSTCAANSALVGINLSGVPVASETCIPCGTGVFANLPVQLNGTCVAACPSDKPFNQNGVCVATCTTSCSGTACPAAQPFVNEGQCVSTCPPGLKIVNNRECAAACPAGQAETPPGTGYCLPVVPPDPRACAASSAGDSTPACQCQSDSVCGGSPNRCVGSLCCTGEGGACDQNNVCCSLVCGPAGTCLAGTGEGCTANADCASGVCTSGKCASGAITSGCRLNSDCLSGDCRQGKCFGGFGDPCSTTSDCSQGTCPQGKCCNTSGLACSANSDCCSGDCNSGLCRSGLGDPCQSAADCTSGSCVSNGTMQVCCLEAGACQKDSDCCAGLQCSSGVCSIGIG